MKAPPGSNREAISENKCLLPSAFRRMDDEGGEHATQRVGETSAPFPIGKVKGCDLESAFMGLGRRLQPGTHEVGAIQSQVSAVREG